MYQGIWGILTQWFRVPKGPPELPVHGPGAVESLRPAPAYLTYLKFGYWVMLVVMCGPLLFAWITLLVMVPIAGVVVAPVVLIILFMLTVVTYLAIHLRYDSTWFVLTDRSMRIRRGIWIIHETTITFENVQNVTVNQGPVQRYFGIADVVVQTAGGASHGAHGEQTRGSHMGLLQGLADAGE
jgi:membrane protein YdbS with pleckstrin-like domain